MKYKDLSDTLKYFKEEGEGGYNMCKLMEDFTEQRYEKGIQKGKIEGKIEGKKEGEKAKAKETARKMLADGMPIDMIAKYSGLSVLQVKELVKENK
jgi:predicted transposase/invertase (TIGR01784 family)